MFSTAFIATLFLINAYNFYSITAEKANIGNIPASNDQMPKDLASDDKMPRSAQIPSEMGMETNSTSGNKLSNNEEKQTNLTSVNQTLNNDKIQKDLTSDDKTLQNKVKSETDLMNGDKSPNNKGNQLNFSSVGKAPRSDKMPSKSKTEKNLMGGNKTPNKEKMQKDLAREGKTPISGKVPSKQHITQSEKKTETETNLPSGNNLPNNDKMQNDGTELLDEFKALLKSGNYTTEGTIILVDWVLEKECKFSENMNKNSEKLEVTDGKNNAELEKFYEIYSKICAENGDKKAIRTKSREELTQMKDILGTQILAQIKKCEKEFFTDEQKIQLTKFGDDFNAFVNELPEMDGKNAIVELSKSKSPFLPSDLIERLLLITKPTTNSKNLETPIVHRRYARSGLKLSGREMKAIKKLLCDIRVILTLATLYFWYYEHNFILVLIIWVFTWFVIKLERRIR